MPGYVGPEHFQILGINRVTRKKFRGVFTAAKLPDEILEPGEFLILNYGTRSWFGFYGHWIVLFRTSSGKTMEIYDVHGTRTHKMNEYIGDFVELHECKQVVCNKQSIKRWTLREDENLDFPTVNFVSAQHSMVFIYLRESGYSMRKILRKFHDLDSSIDANVDKIVVNDKIVDELYNKIFFTAKKQIRTKRIQI